MKKASFRVFLILVLVLPAYLTFFANQNQISSAPVTNLRDQLSSAQLSFFGRVASYAGSIIKIDTNNNPSRTNANLSEGDTLAIADIGVTTSAKYIVKDIGDTATIELASAIGSTNYSGTQFSYAIATRSAIHTVTFTPQVSAIGQTWQFLIKASDRSATGELPMDGIPDQTGFDIGQDVGSTTTGAGTRIKVADITCPFGGGASNIGTTVVITSGVSVGFTGSYHVIQCSGNSTAGTSAAFIIGRSLSTGSQLINPAPGISHTPGQADSSSDTFAYAIRQIDGTTGNVVDTTFGKLAVTESVRVTATVDPTITFTIGTSNSTSVGTTRCTSPLGSTAGSSTATAINFGSLVLNSANNHLAQSLHCTTNSQNGYVIQVFENRPLTMLGATTTIPDTNCNSGGCNSITAAAWTTFTNSGFGYALEVGVTSSGATLGIGTSGYYRSFPIGSGNAQTILSRTNTPSSIDSIYICYRATASTTQQAGTYENAISFIATATF